MRGWGMICPSVTAVDLPHLQHNWFAPFTTVDLSSQKELDADTKAVQQIKFVGQLKYLMLIPMLNSCLF